MNRILCLIVIALFMSTSAIQAQTQSGSTEPNFNANSVYPILNHDVMYKKRVWRRMDLKEKQNKPFFAFNNEITKIIIEAVQAGEIYPYKNDSLLTRLTKEEFNANLKLPDLGGGLTDEEKALGFGDEDEDDGGWGDDEGDGGSDEPEEEAPDLFFPSDISQIEIMEDMIFDKRRSRLYWDIQSLKLVIPAEKFAETTGLEKEVACFKFLDLVKLFRSKPEEALWFNLYNDSERRNLADAFILRLFNARITKVSNPSNADLAEEIGKSPKEVLLYSQQKEHSLMEFEHNLWDF